MAMETEDPIVEVISQHIPSTKPYVLNGDQIHLIRCSCMKWHREGRSRETVNILFGYHLRGEIARVENNDAMFAALANDLEEIAGRQAPRITQWPAAREFVTRYGKQVKK